MWTELSHMKLLLQHFGYIPPIHKFHRERLERDFLGRLGGHILNWIFIDTTDYFTMELEEEGGFKSCTPLVMIKRDKDKRAFYYVHDTGPEDLEKYPWIIHTLGCDDCDLGWRFETREKALSWYNWLVKELTKNNVHEFWKDYSKFMEHFKENQTWSN